MAQNTSSAVMQQRTEARDSLDDFPTPPWATRALCEWLQARWGESLNTMIVREPGANRGYMAAPLHEYFRNVEAFDVRDYGAGFPVRDYLFGPIDEIDATVMNPPFRLAPQFIERALQSSRHFVAVLARTAFLEGVGRYEELFSKTPPTAILQFTRRVVMHKGKVTEKGSTASAYCWLVWEVDARRAIPEFHWTGPVRRQLERPGDYDPRGDQA